jgi:hypothetical protein
MLFTIGTRMRNVLMAAIYRKCLRLSNRCARRNVLQHL